MVWPTLGSRTAKEQNRTICYIRHALELATADMRSNRPHFCDGFWHEATMKDSYFVVDEGPYSG